MNQKTVLQHEWISLNLHKNLHFLTKTKELFYPPPMTSELIHTKKRHKQIILACIMKSFYNFHSFDIFFFCMQASPRKWVTSEPFSKLVINFHYFLESFYHWGLARSQTRHLDSRCVCGTSHNPCMQCLQLVTKLIAILISFLEIFFSNVRSNVWADKLNCKN